MDTSLQSFKRTEPGFVHLLFFERPDSKPGLNLKEKLSLNLVSAWLLTEGEKFSKTNGVTVANSFVILL